jgi:soluble lytic murein transglycosylase-like protein
VSAPLLASQIYQESRFDPFARSSAGAQGMQFMPATARDYGMSNPFDADRAIDAQAVLLRDLLRDFGPCRWRWPRRPGPGPRLHVVPTIPEPRA